MSISPESSPYKGSVCPVAMLVSPASVMGGTTMKGALAVAMGGAMGGAAMGGTMGGATMGGATMWGALAIAIGVARHLQKVVKKLENV